MHRAFMHRFRIYALLLPLLLSATTCAADDGTLVIVGPGDPPSTGFVRRDRVAVFDSQSGAERFSYLAPDLINGAALANQEVAIVVSTLEPPLGTTHFVVHNLLTGAAEEIATTTSGMFDIDFSASHAIWTDAQGLHLLDRGTSAIRTFGTAFSTRGAELGDSWLMWVRDTLEPEEVLLINPGSDATHGSYFRDLDVDTYSVSLARMEGSTSVVATKGNLPYVS
jgi:hypothetical protein